MSILANISEFTIDIDVKMNQDSASHFLMMELPQVYVHWPSIRRLTLIVCHSTNIYSINAVDLIISLVSKEAVEQFSEESGLVRLSHGML